MKTEKLLTFLLALIMITFLMRFLWNQALVPYITVLRPVKSLWKTFLLVLAISMFFTSPYIPQ